MDDKLIELIREKVATEDEVFELGEAEQMKVLDSIADRFVADHDLVWWWEGLIEKSDEQRCGDSVGHQRVAELFEDKSQEVFFAPRTITLHLGRYSEVH